MAQLRQAADGLRVLIERAIVDNRFKAVTEIDTRKTALIGSPVYADADGDAQLHVMRLIDQLITRIGAELQIGIVRELGNGFEESTYPSLVDHLAAAAATEAGAVTTPSVVKPAVSVKTIVAKGMHGLLETPADVDRYVEALRSALIEALNDGKRIAL